MEREQESENNHSKMGQRIIADIGLMFGPMANVSNMV